MTTLKIDLAVDKIPLSSRLANLDELYNAIKTWRKTNPKNFRLDGHQNISPANPSQWIFLEINNFSNSLNLGKDLSGASLTGSDWNGIYYLSGATRFSALNLFVSNYEKFNGDPNKIFTLGFTAGKEGNRKKMKIDLFSEDKNLGQGWFCKKYS